MHLELGYNAKDYTDPESDVLILPKNMDAVNKGDKIRDRCKFDSHHVGKVSGFDKCKTCDYSMSKLEMLCLHDEG
jgi:hypothetical protein